MLLFTLRIISSLRPLLYHEILKTLIRDHFENTIPGIFKRCLNKHAFPNLILKNMGPGPGPWPKNGSGPGPGPAPAAIFGSGTRARALNAHVIGACLYILPWINKPSPARVCSFISGGVY